MKENTIDDEDIRILLMEDDPGIHQSALLMLYDRIAEPVIGFLRKKFIVFSDHDLEEVFGNTIIELSEGIKAGLVDLEKPLKNLVIKIACRRGIDLLRKKNPKRKVDPDYHGDIASILISSGVSSDWAVLASQGVAADIIEEFRTLIPTLPRMQRIVADAMEGAFPISLSVDELCQEIEKNTGERPTLASAKAARLALRKKFSDVLYCKN
ncbi:MAG: sigma-70 family RNA polymerase sigma factor [Akkermansiaceae bacterium]|nr:sigma-70 family RNA polymerase sigma factor [Akkermansiaceae bacterium]